MGGGGGAMTVYCQQRGGGGGGGKVEGLFAEAAYFQWCLSL